ncbi:DUF5672 family protein [Synechococcus sp. BIOS-E4-1]|uniref:DUF5672 family protein n=1 Tax=Synechococcus sp. BIOS-E4-1 TaxID=1400864 RepID=UPI00164481D7|nr:DUF5672 family protein [Synechococcus sp. BIOS-E4-1]
MPQRLRSLELYRVNAFQAHCQIIKMQFLEPWVQSIQNKPTEDINMLPEIWSKENIGAIIIDDRPTPQLRACVLNTLLMGMRRWQVSVYTTSKALDAMKTLFKDLEPFVKINCLEQTDSEFGWNGYNQLLKNADFWQSLDHDKILIFQTDTLLIKPVDFEYFKYDYVGSPWAKNRYDSHSFPRYSKTLNRIEAAIESRIYCNSVPDGLINGNGGLSIRNPKLMAEICIKHSNKSPSDEAEDIFFAQHINSHSRAIAPPEIVESFCCETEYRGTCGAHAAWRYIDARDCAALYEEHCKHVMALVEASTTTTEN